jgi:hypothetical protein
MAQSYAWDEVTKVKAEMAALLRLHHVDIHRGKPWRTFLHIHRDPSSSELRPSWLCQANPNLTCERRPSAEESGLDQAIPLIGSVSRAMYRTKLLLEP